MSYIITNDYRRLIQKQLLTQINNNDESMMEEVNRAAMQEAVSYLVQKYDTTREFADTEAYNPAKEYLAFDRVYLDAPAYNAAMTYIQGELTLQSGFVWVSAVAITVPEAFTPLHWIQLGLQYKIFSVMPPVPEFIVDNYYATGTQVFWKNKVYTALKESSSFSHADALEYDKYDNLPYVNVLPTQPQVGAQYWGAGVPFSVPASTLYASPANNFALQYIETLQTDYTSVADFTSTISLPNLIGKAIIQVAVEIQLLRTTQWSWNSSTGILTLLGITANNEQTLFALYSNVILTPASTQWVGIDNRNAQLVGYVVDIALYHLHTRIAPHDVPQVRYDRYKHSVSWLKDAARGEFIQVDLPIKQAPQGRRIRFGGNVKNINRY